MRWQFHLKILILNSTLFSVDFSYSDVVLNKLSALPRIHALNTGTVFDEHAVVSVIIFAVRFFIESKPYNF